MSADKRHSEDTDSVTSMPSRLTVPGWAGELTPDELQFLRSRLKKSLSLRIRWGFKRSAKRFSEKHIRRVARDGRDK